MAEAIVSFVIERLGNAVIEEVAFFKGVQGQFQRLQKELVSINGFLKTADMKGCDYPDVHTWVADVRDIAYDVDDFIDLFFLKVASKEGSRIIGSSNLLRQCAHVPKKLLNSYKIGKGIEDLFERIEEIDQRRRRYGIKITADKRDEASSSTSNEIRLRRTYPSTEDHNIIGLDEDTNSLVSKLMLEGEELRVVSICGMGGLGKTTLARKVYNHSSVKSHFSCHAWTFISQQCQVGDVLQDILRQVSSVSTGESGRMSESEMMDQLCIILKEKRYLVVLDDIWNKESWDMLKSAFPHGRCGSKVMLTSRNLDVAEYADRWGYKFEPHKLNEDEAWDLILKITSPRDDLGRSRHLSSDMEECGREMVKRCGGLPLKINVLGGILARKSTLRQWEAVSKDIGQAEVWTVLGLSYSDLPFHLKPLFLYLGLYPEDHLIPAKEVIRMWIAEGMVISRQGSQLTMEEVGENYIEELVHRSMIQVGSRYRFGGGVKTFQLHDMMRDLIFLNAREENFFQVVGNDMLPSYDTSSLPMATSKLRRCAIYLGKERYDFSKQMVPCIRTALFFEGKTFDESRKFEIAYKDFKRARVLSFQWKWYQYSSFFPSDLFEMIGKRTNLRYLALNGVRAVWESVELPKSIGNLVFLEVLDLRGSHVRLSNVIWKMIQLRHLYLDEDTKIIGGGMRFDTLKQLQTLSGDGRMWRVTDLVKLTALKKLKATHLSTDMAKTIVDCVVDGLDNLRFLTLDLASRWNNTLFPDLDGLSLKRNLLKLKLKGRMTSFPSNWPSNLVHLQLVESGISEDPMPTLEKLQHLEYLEIYRSPIERMVCSTDGFPQLQHLKLQELYLLEEWIVEKGAMSSLTTLRIHDCRSLKKIPQGLKFLTQLKKLDIVDMLDSLKKRVKQGGEDWQSVQHIPSITFWAN